MTKAYPLFQSISLDPSPSISTYWTQSTLFPFWSVRLTGIEIIFASFRAGGINPRQSTQPQVLEKRKNWSLPWLGLEVFVSFRVPSSNAQNGSFNHRKLNMTGMPTSKIQRTIQVHCTKHSAWLFFQCVCISSWPFFWTWIADFCVKRISNIKVSRLRCLLFGTVSFLWRSIFVHYLWSFRTQSHEYRQDHFFLKPGIKRLQANIPRKSEPTTITSLLHWIETRFHPRKANCRHCWPYKRLECFAEIL